MNISKEAIKQFITANELISELLKNGLYRAVAESKAETQQALFQDIVSSVGGIILACRHDTRFDNQRLNQFTLALLILADYLNADADVYHLNNLWGDV